MSFVAWVTDRRAWLFALLVLAASPAYAQDALPPVDVPCAPEVTTARSLLLTHQGQAGMWFHIDVARCMLGRLEALPLYAARVRLLNERIGLSDQRHELMQRRVALAEEGERRAVDVLGAAERQARESRAEADTERNLRWLWFGLGVALTAVVGGLSIWALGELR